MEVGPLGVAEREVQVREVSEEEDDASGGSCYVGCRRTRQGAPSATHEVTQAPSRHGLGGEQGCLRVPRHLRREAGFYRALHFHYRKTKGLWALHGVNGSVRAQISNRCRQTDSASYGLNPPLRRRWHVL